MCNNIFGDKSVNNDDDAPDIARKPFLDPLNDHVIKTRRNLLLISFFALLYTLSGVKIADHASLFGLVFSNFSEFAVSLSIFALLFYNFISFSIYCYDYYKKSRLRITGSFVNYTTNVHTFGNPNYDYPDDPAQSTILNWMYDNREKISKAHESLVTNIDDFLKHHGNTENCEGDQAKNLINELKQYNNDSKRLRVSLDRFMDSPIA